MQVMVSTLCQVESWAFAVDKTAMDLLIGSGVFYTRECKLCDDGVVVMGEYGLSKAVMERGYNIATLMSMCVSLFMSRAIHAATPRNRACAHAYMHAVLIFEYPQFQDHTLACSSSLKSSR